MRKVSAFAAVLGLLAAPALATTLLQLSIATLSQRAGLIVQGTVTGHVSRWSGDRARIVTDVTVAVTDTLKGTAPSTVTVTQLGGEVGDVGQRVDGVATFHDGEEVIVFLEAYGPTYQLVGMAQGKLAVQRSTDGKVAFAIPDPGAAALLLDPVTREPRAWRNEPYSLDRLRADIHAALNGPAEAPATRPVLKGTTK